MKLKLNIQELKALFSYIQFVMQYVISLKEMDKKSFRIIELNCEILILSEIKDKISIKIMKAKYFKEDKKRIISFKIWESLIMLRYHNVYSHSSCMDQYVNNTLEINYLEWYRQLLK